MANSNLPEAFQAIASDFRLLTDWEDRYRHVIELGLALPRLAQDEKNDANKVSGCVSRVWLVANEEERDGHATVTYRGESDAAIVQGLLAILLALYSGRPAADIADTDAIALLDDLGLREHLTAQRSNGLAAMVRRIREDGRKLSPP
jgi:cysteine desulfuration protein SufE